MFNKKQNYIKFRLAQNTNICKKNKNKIFQAVKNIIFNKNKIP